MLRLHHLLLCTFVVMCGIAPQATAGQDVDVTRLGQHLAPFVRCVSGVSDVFVFNADIEILDGGHRNSVSVRLARIDSESFDLEIKHDEYWVRLQRRADRTAMILPKHQVAFMSEGPVSGAETMKPGGIALRVLGPGTQAMLGLPLLTNKEPRFVALLLKSLLQLKFDDATGTYLHQENVSFRFDEVGNAFELRIDDHRARINVDESPTLDDTTIRTDGLNVVSLPREELERTLSCGVRRALEILMPSRQLTSPVQRERSVPHGELRWIDGHRVVLLHGSPAEIGEAHGTLLRSEAERCMDSVLHMFGIVQTINSGRWFKHDLQRAYDQLQSHIPNDHKVETEALAKAINWEPDLAQILNVFPELFHCSGFAVFGKATKDGKLYHGRVLDYMTEIGLQDSATTFVIAVNGKIPFATVGYGGFIGSVSGMNSNGISLGEMGGHGEGQWDGVPMATLMRRALEECNTLEDVKRLWTESPRTCEYFYVFADGKTNQAVGVAATPDSIEFINPGQGHPLLGDGIEDAVVLSAGDRLATLRSRVQQRHGQIDAEMGQWLMSRPVAMTSNLHNVLFVPEDRVLYVANADHQHVAAERPYVRLDLRELVDSMKTPPLP